MMQLTEGVATMSDFYTKKFLKFDKKIVMIGFGSIGQAMLPMLLRHFEIHPDHILIITKETQGKQEAQEYGVRIQLTALTQGNYQEILNQHLQSGDFLLNLSVDVSSIDLIKFCQQRGVLYLDTCIEPWAGGYIDPNIPTYKRTNYALRESALALKQNQPSPTAVLAHGANPGLVSHFTKQAIINIAQDTHINFTKPHTKAAWAQLAAQLNIKVIHIAERDTQVSARPKQKDEFINTWSVNGFIGEGMQPAELGWGSHERHWPEDACSHEYGCQSAIFLRRPGASTRVRTWTPLAGPIQGFLITHNEAISIADFFTVKSGAQVQYRPTVHYAYHPCDAAVLSLHELAGREWQQQSRHRLMTHEIVEGIDELGVLLLGHEKGAYWFGSCLSIETARQLAPYNNATSLQVIAGILGAMIWAIEHPNAGVVEADDIDYEFIMKVATPYLGKVVGHYSDWTPLKDREKLYPENIDRSDPWQFLNIRIV